MVKNPVTATPDMEVNDLRRTMIASGARYLPVLHDGRLIGVISFRDVAKRCSNRTSEQDAQGLHQEWPA